MPLCKIIQIMTWLHLFYDEYSGHRTCVHEYNRIGGNWSIQRHWIICLKGSPKNCSRWDSYFEWWILNSYSQADGLASHSFVPISVRLLNKFALLGPLKLFVLNEAVCICFIICLCLLTYILSAMSARKISLTGTILHNQRNYVHVILIFDISVV